MTVSLRYAARSDVGLVRASNQDSAYAGPHLLVVADGMGGHAGGDIASRIAIENLRHLDTATHTPDAALADLEAAVEEARQGLVRASTTEPELAGMGTTVTALLRTGSTLVMAHMGDSRAYLLRDGALTQVTVDHTFVQHLVDTGRISPDEAEHHPQRNVVMRVLSDFDVDLHPDMSVREAKVGDRWLLCSDGLSGFVHVDVLGEILSEAHDPGEAADLLLLAAMHGGSTDNITVIVADVVDDDGDDDIAAEAEGDPGLPAAASGGVGGVQVVGAATGTGPIPGSVPPEDTTPSTSSDDGVDGSPHDDDAHPPSDDDGPDDEDPDDADARPAPRRHPVIATLVTLVVLAALGAGGWGAYQWTQQQYFVGVSDDQVAIFRGIPASAGPVTLSHPVELTGTRVSDLPAFFAARLDGTIRASSLADAQQRAARLIEQAEEAEQAAQTPTPSPSPSPTPTPTPSGTPSGTPSPDPSQEPADEQSADKEPADGQSVEPAAAVEPPDESQGETTESAG
ncbi:protein serine/threonine phosphatase [Xylanimonas cellulosilytica DSM 15894]|uniref:Protein serine/threonine phosphatase n=1 Tax=Xylanimonas cellulosilytica (strain DSM 15894 / JCM 12276 / CECT 5975 / KCTC 9989 / LMG 20990 / NBRC 107835 / XIL07) TaxID=446471 RepID=D1BTC1_XYLCX|nr:protein phosphatase 2C domain-containing protein [Xylanimonas cellulosilytica]ACZ29063.1 protein serine/threonine phosphatase [Xylanimonas cellulosilytica DSM 15894]